MKNKLKIYVSIFSITLVVVALFFATTSILAATNHNVNSPFTVGYTAPAGVEASMTACYYMPDSTSANVLKDESSQNTLELDRGTSSGSLSTNSAPTLTVTNYFVIFEFGFTNTTSAGRSITVTMTNTSTYTGDISVLYGKSNAVLVESKSAVKAEEISDMWNCASNTSGESGYTLGTAITLAPAATVYIYMLVKINDTGFSSSASYTSTALSGINFSLSKSA